MNSPRSEDPYGLTLFAADSCHELVSTRVVGKGRVGAAFVFGDVGFRILRHGDGIGDVVVTCDSVVRVIDYAVPICCGNVEPPAEDVGVSGSCEGRRRSETDSPTLKSECPSLCTLPRLHSISDSQAGFSGVYVAE